MADAQDARLIEYRADGWPLCPSCGEDELADLDMRDLPYRSFKADPSNELTCYRCRWVGTVPLKPKESPMDLSTLTDAQVLGLTAAAEARAQFVPGIGWKKAPIENMVAVMCAVANRVKADPQRFGATAKDVCLKPKQFSCWNPGTPNNDWLVAQVHRMQNDAPVDMIAQGCIDMAPSILTGQHPDMVNGGTHYYSPVSMVPPGSVPTWAEGKEPVATVGDHLFFLGV